MKKMILVGFMCLMSGFQSISAQAKENPIARSTAKEEITQQDMANEKYFLEIRDLQYANIPKVSLSNLVTEPIQIANLNTQDLPASFDPIVKLGIEKKKPFAYIMIPHFIKQGNGVIKLKSYSLQVEEIGGQQKVTGNRVYAANSVLSSGTFYTVSISSQGVFKMDYDFLTNKLGLNASAIVPANIRLYGNGGEILPESNGIIPLDDLVENAIQVVGGEDGQFNQGDYILFYANGPHTITKDSLQKRFGHVFNIYNEVSYYYLNFDKGPGKRINNHLLVTGANTVVNSFNEFQFYERDSVNHGRFGKEFWADEMSSLPGRSLSKTLNFNIPHVDVTAPVSLFTRTGSITYAAPSFMRVSVNGTQVQNLNYLNFGTNYYDPVIQISNVRTEVNVTGDNFVLRTDFTPGSADASGYIGYITLNARRLLKFNGYLNFADWNSVGNGNIAEYFIQDANASTQVWDITDPLSPQKMQGQLNGSVFQFTQSASQLHRFVALDGSQIKTPTYIGQPDNQNLHNLVNIDYIIVAPTELKGQAQRLANHHQQKRGYTYAVVTPQEIYNEFSSGSQDIAAIRNFIKMLYDKSSMEKLPANVLLFGDASYDYKNRLPNNTNLVPTHETNESNNKILGYCSDDFYGFLDDNENLNDYTGSSINTLDIGVGRLPVSTFSDATKLVNKIINYDSPNSFGPWKNNVTFNADNGDGARHLDDGEIMSKILTDSVPVFNISKIYVDGFVLESTPAGPRTPDANTAVLANMFNGTFLMNYNGHGGPGGWCEERIFSFNDINNLKNINRLPLFITATCDFAPFDNPAYVSAGESLVNKPDGGGIALMTTTQLVFADQNQIMNANYMKKGFTRSVNGRYPSMGEAARLSKNLRYVTYIDEGTAANFRKFALLGDPGLPLSFPTYQVKTDSINGVSVSVQYDTLKALGKYTISGHVTDQAGNFLSDYNGVVYPTIFDKSKKLTTLQSVGDPKREYLVQNNAVYKGKASVKNGKFSFTFVMPKDINYEIAKGKISYYTNSETMDGNGYDNGIYIGGSFNGSFSDNTGPIIKPYMNDEKFVNGGITTPNSKLIVKLFDDNGINYSGNSIGHDITAVLDNNPQNTYVLNNFFEADLDDYRSGVVRFPLDYLTEGEHTLTIKAWDIANNSSEASLRFIVVNTEEGKLAHVLNYPNPFNNSTQFMFEHNMPNQNLHVNIQIFSMTGKVVKSIRTLVQTEGTRNCAIDWDGRDEMGDILGNGVYLYKLAVKSSEGLSDSKLEKLIILR